MKNARKRWIGQPPTDFHSYLQKKQWEFRFYSSNIYILNHVWFYLSGRMLLEFNIGSRNSLSVKFLLMSFGKFPPILWLAT